MVERRETDANVDCYSAITPEEWMHIAQFTSLSTDHWITPFGDKTPVACLALARGVQVNESGYFIDEGAVRNLYRLFISALGYAQVNQYKDDCKNHPGIILYYIQNKVVDAYITLHKGIIS